MYVSFLRIHLKRFTMTTVLLYGFLTSLSAAQPEITRKHTFIHLSSMKECSNNGTIQYLLSKQRMQMFCCRWLSKNNFVIVIKYEIKV